MKFFDNKNSLRSILGLLIFVLTSCSSPPTTNDAGNIVRLGSGTITGLGLGESVTVEIRLYGEEEITRGSDTGFTDYEVLVDFSSGASLEKDFTYRAKIIESPSNRSCTLENANGNYSSVGKFDQINVKCSFKSQAIRCISNCASSVGDRSFPYICNNGSTIGYTEDESDGQKAIFAHDLVSSESINVSVTAGTTVGSFSGVSGSQSYKSNNDCTSSVFSSTDAAKETVSKPILASAVSKPTVDSNSVSDIFFYDVKLNDSTRVSVPNLSDQTTLGVEANKASFETAISGDGKVVAFNSSATNLVLDDTNNAVDVFLHYIQTGETKRISVPNKADEETLGVEGNIGSFWEVSLNSDGGKAAFRSNASNLVIGDTNGVSDIFIHDIVTSETKRIVPNLADQETLGTESNGDSYNGEISADGTMIVFASDANNFVAGDTNNVRDIFSFVVATGAVNRLSVDSNGVEGNDLCSTPKVNDTGLYVVFTCRASNLVADDTNNFCDNNFDGTSLEQCDDIFVHNTETSVTMRVNVAADGSEGNGRSANASITGSGQFIVFESDATNLVANDANNFKDIFHVPNPLYSVQ